MAPVTFVASLWFLLVRRVNVKRMPVSKAIFQWVGVLPIRNHYYDPLFKFNHLQKSLSDDRHLPGIDWNVDEQRALLEQLCYSHEIADLTREPNHPLEYHYDNTMFEYGDADFLYNAIRHFKPQRLIEIGCGYSTRIAVKALQMNQQDAPGTHVRHVCIEPYENQWLEQLPIEIIRTPVEKLDLAFFEQLEANDILFIDSSHMIRPQGDVLFEYLEVLPTLKSGVIVHVHDIFSPKDYPKEWVMDSLWFWNEQYLLEAFLSLNTSYKIIAALNFLYHHYPEELFDCLPGMKKAPEGTPYPGSFWLQKC
jgi:predicted O-methyltransferase YrrM